MSKTWPYSSLTQAPTNLKEAIDWVLRVTGRDGKNNNKAAQPQSTDSPPHCLCYLAKAVKDLLYDAKDPGSPGPSTDRYWDNILLEQEKDIVHPVLQDLGLLSGGSTGAASTRDTCAGGTEVIKALIDQLAGGLQKWVGWQEGEEDKCCLKGTNGIGKKCDCPGGGGNCCGTGGSGTTCHECSTCGTSANGDTANKCYLSAYCKKNSTSSGGSPTEGDYYWPTISSDSTKVHLLARIFLGSVCLIWSGLSQLGFLTGKGGSRWEKDTLSEVDNGLGSFMAAMGYDLERLNQGGTEKKGDFVQTLLTGSGAKGIQWKEFTGDSTGKDSVAEYYSSIYGAAQSAAKGSAKSTESICKDYPLLVLHILASGYFRAGSAGAKGVTTPPKAAGSTSQSATTSDPKKDTVPRKPKTIREILYWLSALPYSEGYRALVERMKGKMDGILPKEEQDKGELKLHSESTKASTTLKRDDITHYLMAACGYCPLVLIGIQGTIEREVKTEAQPAQAQGSSGSAAGSADQKKCPEHSKDRNKRCTLEDAAKAAPQAPAPAAASTGKPLEKGQVCYGGYHLEVSSFGPLHGMYANGLFGFQMEISPAQCLDQLRIYVYHCFYQLYFLRKQCTVGVESGAVLGWQSCRYGSGVGSTGGKQWACQTSVNSGKDHTKSCGLQDQSSSTSVSPLMAFLCDGISTMACRETLGVSLNSQKQNYPEIVTHMNTNDDFPKGHLSKRHGHCPVPMGFQSATNSAGETHFKDLNYTHKTLELEKGQAGQQQKYPAHCTGNTLSLLLEYYCDPVQCPSGTLVVLLRLLACITPTVPRTLGDLFGFYYYIVYIGGKSASGVGQGVYMKLEKELRDVRLSMLGGGPDGVVKALEKWKNGGDCSTTNDTLKCLVDCTTGTGAKYLSPLSGQQYGQLSPLMAGTYLSWLVYLIEKFEEGLRSLEKDYRDIACRDDCNTGQGAVGCGGSGQCRAGTHGDTCPAAGGSGSAGSAVAGKGGSGVANQGVCGCDSVVSCTGVLPVLYRYGFGYGDVSKLHNDKGTQKKCHEFLRTLESVLQGDHLKTDSKTGLHHEINQLIYTTRLPWIFVLTIAWLVAVLYLAFGAIWPLDWTHMRSHCRGWFRKGSLSPWEVLMVGKKKGRGILEYFGRK